MITIGIDPSVTCTGVAIFNEGRYVHAYVSEARTVAEACAKAAGLGDVLRKLVDGGLLPRDAALRFAPIAFVVELPRVYPTSKQKGDPNDLIAVAAVAGAYAGLSHFQREPARYVHPSTWKGQVPKEIVEQRIKDRMIEWPADDVARWAEDMGKIARTKRHNATDAIGIAMWGIENPW